MRTIIRDSVERFEVQATDALGQPVEATGYSLRLSNAEGVVIHTAATGDIEVPGEPLGHAYYDWLADRTDGDYLATWRATLPGGAVQEETTAFTIESSLSTSAWTTVAIIKAFTQVDVDPFTLFQAQSDVDAAYNTDTSFRDEMTQQELNGLAKAVLWQAVTLQQEADKAKTAAPIEAGVSETWEQGPDKLKHTLTRSHAPVGKQSADDAVLDILCPRARQLILNLPKYTNPEKPALVTSHRPSYGRRWDGPIGTFSNKYNEGIPY